MIQSSVLQIMQKSLNSSHWAIVFGHEAFARISTPLVLLLVD